MVLPVDTALAHIKHTLRSAGSNIGEIPGISLLNQAGHSLVDAHTWKWCEGAHADVAFQANVAHAWLPKDFSSLTAYEMRQSLVRRLSLGTTQGLVDISTSSVSVSTWRYWGVIVHSSVASAARGTFALDGTNPADGEVIAIEDGQHNPDNTWTGSAIVTGRPGTRFTFKTTLDPATELADDRQVLIGTAAGDTLTNLVDAINAAPDLDLFATESTTTTLGVDLSHTVPGVEGNSARVSDLDGILDVTALTSASRLYGGLDGGAPRARIDLWTTPLADDPAAIRIYYRRGWNRLDDDSDYVDIPEWLEGLYLQAVRAYARGYQMEDSTGAVPRLLEEIWRSKEFANKRMRDDQIQPRYGVIRNGAAASHGSSDPFWNFGTVADPV